MFQRNRIVRVALIVAAVFVLAAPAPSFAARPSRERAPQARAWQLALSLLSNLVFPGVGARPVLTWENEGGAIDPNGTVTLTMAPGPLKPLSGKPGSGQ
ncbi:MAG TPA: hypothetical protein VLX28_00200 [Thermoanaerobaculia bacterium]|nr:hypothetical protein [Thermoanaerobaculia bacterium]